MCAHNYHHSPLWGNICGKLQWKCVYYHNTQTHTQTNTLRSPHLAFGLDLALSLLTLPLTPFCPVIQCVVINTEETFHWGNQQGGIIGHILNVLSLSLLITTRLIFYEALLCVSHMKHCLLTSSPATHDGGQLLQGKTDKVIVGYPMHAPHPRL